MLIHKAGTLRPHGAVFVTDPTSGQTSVESDTLQCVHCGMHWRVIVGSGRERGFCRNCMGPSCGAKDCTEHCVPWEKKMEAVEAEERFVITGRTTR